MQRIKFFLMFQACSLLALVWPNETKKMLIQAVNEQQKENKQPK